MALGLGTRVVHCLEESLMPMKIHLADWCCWSLLNVHPHSVRIGIEQHLNFHILFCIQVWCWIVDGPPRSDQGLSENIKWIKQKWVFQFDLTNVWWRTLELCCLLFVLPQASIAHILHCLHGGSYPGHFFLAEKPDKDAELLVISDYTNSAKVCSNMCSVSLKK